MDLERRCARRPAHTLFLLPKRAAGAGKAGEGVTGGVNKHSLNGAGHPLVGFAPATPEFDSAKPTGHTAGKFETARYSAPISATTAQRP
ncbi:MAG: hypothetical protein J0M00_25275 [Burkholderiales bacterium]|nr:hypothetical protein [Burkholderiales bacterium]